MATAVRACGDHGYFEGDTCPVCDADGEPVLPGHRRRRLSKFVSGALRHFPVDAGVELDDGGWTTVDELVAAVDSNYDWAARDHLDAVVATDPKGRFERARRDGERVVRAAYGHSVAVELDDGDAAVPDTLYHGTAPRNIDSILSEGLEPMGRQEVHLSGNVADARDVGARHAADPVVLAVDAAAMVDDGFAVAERGPSTFATDRVPPRYVSTNE